MVGQFWESLILATCSMPLCWVNINLTLDSCFSNVRQSLTRYQKSITHFRSHVSSLSDQFFQTANNYKQYFWLFSITSGLLAFHCGNSEHHSIHIPLKKKVEKPREEHINCTHYDCLSWEKYLSNGCSEIMGWKIHRGQPHSSLWTAELVDSALWGKRHHSKIYFTLIFGCGWTAHSIQNGKRYDLFLEY